MSDAPHRLYLRDGRTLKLTPGEWKRLIAAVLLSPSHKRIRITQDGEEHTFRIDEIVDDIKVMQQMDQEKLFDDAEHT